MAKQKHDIGWQKRAKRTKAAKATHDQPTNPRSLSRRLVKNGTAPTGILGANGESTPSGRPRARHAA